MKSNLNQNLIWNTSTVINMIINPVLLFFGIIGNGLGLYVMRYIRKRRVTASYLYYYYLTYIAWINLVICIFGACRIGEDIRNLITHTVYSYNYVWLHFHAHYTLVIINGFFGASILILCLLLWDRFMNLRKPLRHHKIDNVNMSNSFISNCGVTVVGINTRNWKMIVLKLSPLFFILISNVICFSSYFWYDVIECNISRNTNSSLNYPGNFESELNRNNYKKINDTLFYVKEIVLEWTVTYDLIRMIILLVIPGFFILFYGFGVTYYVFKFMAKRDKAYLMERKKNSVVRVASTPLGSTLEIENIKSLDLIGPSYQKSVTLNTEQSEFPAEDGNTKQNFSDITPVPTENTDIHAKKLKNSNGSSLRAKILSRTKRRFFCITPTPVGHRPIRATKPENRSSLHARILTRNLSALIYFALYCLCEIPNIVVSILRDNIKSKLVIDISNTMELVFVTLIFYVFMLFDNNFHEEFRELNKSSGYLRDQYHFLLNILKVNICHLIKK
ncbi:unnamed protein product [Gordionus sp. m RMFG-2023]